MTRLVILVVLFLANPATAASVNVAIAAKNAPVTPPTTTDWSVYGVLPSNPDNTAALNSIPGGVNVSCGTVGQYNFSGHWNWQSNYSLFLSPACELISSLSFTGNTGVITQSDVLTPLDTVYVSGLNIRKTELSPGVAQPGKMFRLNINHFTFVHNHVGLNDGVFFVQGSDHEFGFNTVTDSPVTMTGRPAIRHFCNAPKVATTAGRPANVWVHDNNMQSGDGVYQVAPAPANCCSSGASSFVGSITGAVLTVTSTFQSGPIVVGARVAANGILPNTLVLSQTSGTPGGVGTYSLNQSQTIASQDMITTTGPGSADDYLFENNYGLSLAAPVIILGAFGGSVHGTSPYDNCNISNVVFRGITGAGGGTAITVQNEDNLNGGLVSNITVKDTTIDSSADTTNNGSVFLEGWAPGPGTGVNNTITGITIDNVKITNPLATSFEANGQVTGTVVKNSNFGAPRSGNRNIVLRNTTGLQFINNVVGGQVSPMQFGPITSIPGQYTVHSPVITGNTFSGVGNNGAGVNMLNVDGATVTGNSFAPAAGATKAAGVALTAATASDPGSTNNTITGNDVSAMTNNPKIICAPPGQLNVIPANSNTGFPAGCP